MPFPWSGSTGSPVAEGVSRQGHVLDGGLALDWWSEDGRPTSLELGQPIRLRCHLTFMPGQSPLGNPKARYGDDI